MDNSFKGNLEQCLRDMYSKPSIIPLAERFKNHEGKPAGHASTLVLDPAAGNKKFSLPFDSSVTTMEE